MDSPAGNGGRGGKGGGPGHGGATGAGGKGGGMGAGGRIGAGTGGFSGAAGSSGATGGSSSTGGASGSGGGSSGSGGAQGCSVQLQAVAPTSFANIEAGPRVKLRMSATAIYSAVAMPTWSWAVTEYPNAVSAIVHPTVQSRNDTASIVDLPIDVPARFDIVATVIGDARCTGNVSASGVPAGPPKYVFRTRAGDFPVQDPLIKITTASNLTIPLDRGLPYSIRPHGRDPLVLLPAYVRVTTQASPFRLEGDTSHGAVMTRLLSTVTYDLVIVPADQSYAPFMKSALPGDWEHGIDLDQGIHVSAKALAPDGTPLEDARLVLRQDQLPSTVGASGPTGDLDLWARAGNLSVVAVPPRASGLPQGNVDVAASGTLGVVLPAGAGSASLAIRWNAVTQGALTLVVRGVDGSTAVEKAQVRVSSSAWVAPVPVATIVATVPGAPDVTLPALGTIDVSAASDATGTAVFPRLPVGTYDVVVTPPSGAQGNAAPAALTGLSVALPADGASRTITLARKVPLKGRLAPLQAAGSLITAFDQTSGPTGPPATATAGADGVFTLLVDPDRSYELVIQPPPGPLLGRTVVGAIAAGAAGLDAGTLAVTPGRAFKGTVVGDGAAVGDAFIQVFCEVSASTCVDPSISLAEATSRSDGTFDLVLPDTTVP